MESTPHPRLYAPSSLPLVPFLLFGGVLNADIVTLRRQKHKMADSMDHIVIVGAVGVVAVYIDPQLMPRVGYGFLLYGHVYFPPSYTSPFS